MSNIPYWFEAFGNAFPWIVPSIALVALWLARSSNDDRFRRNAERVFFGALFVVAWGTLRTVLANEGCWIIHMTSLAVMIVGSIFPAGEFLAEEPA